MAVNHTEMQFIDLRDLSSEEIQGINQALREPIDLFWSEKDEKNSVQEVPEQINQNTRRPANNRDRRYNNHKNYNKNNYQKSYEHNNSNNYNNGSNGDHIDAMQNLNIETNVSHPSTTNAMNMNVGYNQTQRNGLTVYNVSPLPQQNYIYPNHHFPVRFQGPPFAPSPSFIMNSPNNACDNKQEFTNHQYPNYPQSGHGIRLQHPHQSQEYPNQMPHIYPYSNFAVPFPSNNLYQIHGYPQHIPPQQHHPQQIPSDANYQGYHPQIFYSQPSSQPMVYAQNNMVDNFHNQFPAVTPPPSNDSSSSPLTINSNQVDHDNFSDSPQSVTPVNDQNVQNERIYVETISEPETPINDSGVISGPEASQDDNVSSEEFASSVPETVNESLGGDIPSEIKPESEPELEPENVQIEAEPKEALKTEISWASIASKKVPAKPVAAVSNQTRPPKPTPVQEQQDNLSSVQIESPNSVIPANSPTVSQANNEVAKSEKKSKKSKKSDPLNYVTKVKVEEDSFAYEIVQRVKNYKLNHAYPTIVPSGLINRGNYCYINAVLQALLASPPFYNLMRDLINSLYGIIRPESCTPILDSFVRFFAEFPPSHDLRTKLKNAQQSNTLTSCLETLLNKSFEPICIRQALKFIGMTNEQGLQEDAEEFFSNVLNGMNDEFIAMEKYFESRQNGDASESEYKNDEDSEDSLWKEVGTRSKNKTLLTRTASVVSTPIADIFQGFTLDIRTIANQSKESMVGNRQPFFTFQLDIKAPSIKTLEDALRCRTQPENIDGYICSQTKQTVQASSQTFLEVLPPILVLHLKLFDYDASTNSSSKVLKRIQFEESFEIPKECLSRHHRGLRTYKLLAVVSHSGSEAQKGHYITEVYQVGLNKWLRCDDSNVKVTDLNQVLKGGETNLVPYLLFYRRYDTILREGEQYNPRNNNNRNEVTNSFTTQNRYARN